MLRNNLLSLQIVSPCDNTKHDSSTQPYKSFLYLQTPNDASKHYSYNTDCSIRFVHRNSSYHTVRHLIYLLLFVTAFCVTRYDIRTERSSQILIYK